MDIASRLDDIAEWVEHSSSFVAEQAPLVVQEMLRWEAAVCLAYILIPVIVAAFVEQMIRRHGVPEGRSFLRCLLAIPSFFYVAYGAMGLIKVFLAPRLVILDSIRGYIGGI